MPIGKSGSYHISPNEMRRKGDMPDEKGPKSGPDRPPDQEQGGDEGDGNHHHEIVAHGDGTMHSVHTNPDGSKDEQDHGSYDEAKAHMDASMGQDDQQMPPDDSGGDEDMAGMYAGDCK